MDSSHAILIFKLNVVKTIILQKWVNLMGELANSMPYGWCKWIIPRYWVPLFVSVQGVRPTCPGLLHLTWLETLVARASAATLFMKFSNTLGPAQKGLIVVLLVILAIRCDTFYWIYPKKHTHKKQKYKETRIRFSLYCYFWCFLFLWNVFSFLRLEGWQIYGIFVTCYLSPANF